MPANKKTPLYAVNAVLASCVLYFALDLSASGRTAIDWTVLSLISAAVLYNLVQLGRRLHRSGGGKALWHLLRTLLFWILGLLNTALIRPEEIDTWRYPLGWVLLVLAAADTVALIFDERKGLAPPAPQAE